MHWFKRSSQHPSIELSVSVDVRPRLNTTPRSSIDDYSRIIIPTDLMFSAWRQLFPAERMVVFGGRSTPKGVYITSVSDVTEPRPSVAHVRASTDRIGQSLIDFERTGAHLAVWMHSHPGEGLGATCPSAIDVNQDRELRLNYSSRLIGIIVVRDGWLRLFGEAITRDRIQIRWIGRSIEPVPGERHVHRLLAS